MDTQVDMIVLFLDGNHTRHYHQPNILVSNPSMEPAVALVPEASELPFDSQVQLQRASITQ